MTAVANPYPLFAPQRAMTDLGRSGCWSPAQRASAAERLWTAERERAPIEPLTDTYPGIDVVDAYEIQLLNIRRRLGAGARIVGHKVGLSSPVMQQMMGVDEPDYGHLLDTMVLSQRHRSASTSTATPASRWRSPTCSVPPCPVRDAPRRTYCAATEYVVPSLELIDSRIVDWRIRWPTPSPTTPPRPASSSAMDARLAGRRVAGSDVADIDVVLYAGDQEVARGNTSAVLGDPDHRRGVAGPQGRGVRRDLGGRPRHPPRLVHASSRRAPRRNVPRRVHRARLRYRSIRIGDIVTKATAAIVGSGNIGTDLLYKLLRSEVIEPRWMVGIDPDSPGLKRAARPRSGYLRRGRRPAVGEPNGRTSSSRRPRRRVHVENAPKYRSLGIQAVDLTPAAIGPAVVPAVNLGAHLDAPNVSLITCGGQATIPIVHAVSRVTEVSYAEIVASVASRSAGPGTRANIDEFTRTTARGIETIGGARKGKAIIILNPAEPPMLMQDTVFCAIPPDADREAITDVDQGDRRGGRVVRPRLPTAGRAAVRRSRTGQRWAGPGRGLHRGGGCRRLPTAVLGQPRHHDRRRGQGR